MTPALTGTLLPGVTRDSLLTLAADLGYAAEEGKISTDEWREGNESGAITEVFACGTAAVITPVGAVDSANGGWTIGDGAPGPVSMRLREQLLAIQTGRVEDTARLDAPAGLSAVTRSRVRPGRSPAAASCCSRRSGVRLLPGRWLPVMSSHR